MRTLWILGAIVIALIILLILVNTVESMQQPPPPKNDFYQVDHLWRVKEVITADSLEFRVYEVWRGNHWTILSVHKETGNMTSN